MMRALAIFFCCLAILGCDWIRSDQKEIDHRVLTEVQIDRLKVLCAELNLPYGHQLEGKRASDYEELLDLADGTTSENDDETIYHFTIPGISDGGSDGYMSLKVKFGKICETGYAVARD